MSPRLGDPDIEKDHVAVYYCVCPNPRPRFIPIFGGYECAKCGYKVHDLAIGTQKPL